MHVLHVMADGNAGGGPTVVLTICKELQNRDIDVSVVTSKNSYLLSRCREFGIDSVGMDFFRRGATLALRREIAGLIGESKPDIIHAHGARSALPVALLGHTNRPGFIYTVHGFHYSAKSWPMRQAGRLSEKLCIGRADATIFVSKGDARCAMADRLTSSGPRPIIYNGVTVPPDLIQPMAERRYDIAFVARLHRQKNPLVLPDILLAMRPARPSMVIVGSGDLETPLREKIEQLGLGDQITMLDAMPREQALATLAQARTFILPSLWEGLPVSLAEAMRLRVAIVASRIAGNDEIIADGETGFLVDPSDVAGFADRLGELLSQPALHDRVVANASAYVAHEFSAERQVAEHLALYRKILGTD